MSSRNRFPRLNLCCLSLIALECLSFASKEGYEDGPLWERMEGTMAAKDVISIAVVGMALVVSIIVAVRTRRYNRILLRATHRNNYMNALLNLSREMVGHPELWAVYDQNWRPQGHDSR